MSLDPNKLPPLLDAQGRDPLGILLVDEMYLDGTSKSERMIWAVGDTWVINDGSGWSIGADVPATENEVRQLLMNAGGEAELLDYHEKIIAKRLVAPAAK